MPYLLVKTEQDTRTIMGLFKTGTFYVANRHVHQMVWNDVKDHGYKVCSENWSHFHPKKSKCGINLEMKKRCPGCNLLGLHSKGGKNYKWLMKDNCEYDKLSLYKQTNKKMELEPCCGEKFTPLIWSKIFYEKDPSATYKRHGFYFRLSRLIPDSTVIYSLEFVPNDGLMIPPLTDISQYNP